VRPDHAHRSKEDAKQERRCDARVPHDEYDWSERDECLGETTSKYEKGERKGHERHDNSEEQGREEKCVADSARGLLDGPDGKPDGEESIRGEGHPEDELSDPAFTRI